MGIDEFNAMHVFLVILVRDLVDVLTQTMAKWTTCWWDDMLASLVMELAQMLLYLTFCGFSLWATLFLSILSGIQAGLIIASAWASRPRHEAASCLDPEASRANVCEGIMSAAFIVYGAAFSLPPVYCSDQAEDSIYSVTPFEDYAVTVFMWCVGIFQAGAPRDEHIPLSSFAVIYAAIFYVVQSLRYY